jgi:hypothetical protein
MGKLISDREYSFDFDCTTANDSTLDLCFTAQVIVEFGYTPAEPAESGRERQYPGMSEYVDVGRIYVNEMEGAFARMVVAQLEGLYSDLEAEILNAIRERREAHSVGTGTAA